VAGFSTPSIPRDARRGGAFIISLQKLGKALLVGDGVQGLKQKDVEALLADLTEKLPEMVPGLP
jgi:hypothetical protein